MANKKKPAPKKVAKPAKKAAAKKPVAKKPMKKDKKPALKKAPPVSKKPAPKALPVKAKPVAPPKVDEKPAPKKPGQPDPKSLVSIKPKVSPVIKKEPPKPTKVIIPKTTTKSSVKYEPEFTKSVLDSPAYQHSGPSLRYSDTDLVEFREIIQKKLDS